MTLHDELRAAVARVEHARDTELEAKAEVAQLEAKHRALYDARHEAIGARVLAEGDAKQKRLVLYHLAVQNGEWAPGEGVYGLSVERHQIFEYDDDAALWWLLIRLQSKDEEAWHWLRGALDKHRTAFESLIRHKDVRDRWIGLKVRMEPRAKIAQGFRLAAQVNATDEADAHAAQEAEDAIADLATRMTQEELH